MIISNKTKLYDLILDLISSERRCFTIQDIQKKLDSSPDTIRNSLNRLIKKGVIASPARGFFVVVPPEYRRIGCLLPSHFIDELMEYENRLYYFAMRTAAEMHGAAHHRPQRYQVAVEGQRSTIDCGRIVIYFMSRKNIANIPVQTRRTSSGNYQYSTPETTALDVVGFAKSIGGMDYAATILAELAEAMDPDRLVTAAKSAPIAWSQRLGFLLELVDFSDLTVPLKAYVEKHAYRTIPLSPYYPIERGALQDSNWRLIVNNEVVSEV